MEIKTNNQCIKLLLPNGKVVDVLNSVLDEIVRWVQDEIDKPESGGYIVGYQHEKTGNITLEKVSVPHLFDVKNRVLFEIRDPAHKIFLAKAKRKKSYYMGAWHTHPQVIPVPSDMDWEDWYQTLKIDRTGGQYVFFIIAGTREWRIWIGDFSTGKISEGKECPKDKEGIYLKGAVIDEECIE